MADIAEIKKTAPPVQVWYVKDAFGEIFLVRCHTFEQSESGVSFKFNGNLIAQFSDFSDLIKAHDEVFSGMSH